MRSEIEDEDQNLFRHESQDEDPFGYGGALDEDEVENTFASAIPKQIVEDQFLDSGPDWASDASSSHCVAPLGLYSSDG